MKKLYTLAFALLVGASSFAQNQKTVKVKVDRRGNEETGQAASRFTGAQPNAPSAVTATLISTTPYVAGTTMDLTFVLNLTNTDGEYGDSLSLTFPAGIVPLSSTANPIYAVTEGQNPEALNGVNGQTITWGDNDNNFGGLELNTPISFTVNCAINPSLSGPQIGSFFVSGDQYANPADYSGTFTILDPTSADMANILTTTNSGCNLTNTEDVTVIYWNSGSTVITSFDLSYSVNGGAAVTETVTETLNPGDTSIYTFTNGVDMSAFGNYDIQTWITFMGDVASTNDTSIFTATHYAPLDATYASQSFEATDDLSNWKIKDEDGDGASWALTTSVPQSGSRALRVLQNTNLATNDFLFSNCVDFTAGNYYNLSYYQRVTTGYNGGVGAYLSSNQSNTGITDTLVTLVEAAGNSSYVQKSSTFTVPTSGTYYLVMESKNSNAAKPTATRLDNIVLQQYFVFFRDQDNDGFGTSADSVISAAAPTGYVANKLDCDDNNALYAPIYADSSTITICSGDSALINGDYETSAGIYTQNFSGVNGCDSIIVTTLVVNASYNSTNNATICQGESITVNGNMYSTAGTFVDSMQTINGCDSIITTVLFVNATDATANNQTICDGQSITVGNNTYTTAGTYVDSLQNVNGCDSVVTTMLTVNPTYNVTEATVAICMGDSAFIYGNYQTAAGIYTNTLQTVNGCDSILTTELVVNPTYTVNESYQICSGDSMFVGGAYQTMSGTFYDTLTTVNGCDSIIVSALIVTNSIVNNITTSICDGDSVFVGGAFQTIAGTYTDTFVGGAAAGCDSIINTTVVVNVATTGTDSVISCDSYTWIDGNTYTADNNTATYTTTNAAGCDSVITLNLVITHSTSSTDVTSACDSLTWIDGNTYTADNNTATYTVTNAAGCDSVITLNLTITHSTSSFDVQYACDSYTWIDGNTYTADNNTATYTVTNAAGCDSVITLDLTINASPIVDFVTNDTTICDNGGALALDATPANGSFAGTGVTGASFDPTGLNGINQVTYTFTDNNGCSATATLNITVDICSSVKNTSANAVTVMPNPTTGLVKVNFGHNTNAVVKVTDLTGKVVYASSTENTNSLSIDLTTVNNGVYFIEVAAGNAVNTYKVVKQ